jgi:hypothetical protein
MRKLNIWGPALFVLIAPFLGNTASAISVNPALKVTYAKKPLSAAKNPLTKKFLSEQKRITQSGFSTPTTGMGTSSINCGLVPDAEECAPIVESGFWEYPYYNSVSDSFDTATVELERVTIDGKSSCAGSISTSFGSYYSICGVLIATDPTFTGMPDLDLGAIRDIAKDFIAAVTPEPPKKLVKCIFDREIAASNPGMNLQKDAKEGYSYAEMTFMKIYGPVLPGIEGGNGNGGGMTKSSVVDVKYPDGYVVTFNVYINWDNTAVELTAPKLNEKVNSGENACA